MALKNGLPLTVLLIVGTCLSLTLTVVTIHSSGALAYWLVFHKPFSLSASTQTYTPPNLPTVQLTPSISLVVPHAGTTEIVTVGVHPSAVLQGFLVVWITSPDNRQVYQSPMDDRPSVFAGDTTTLVTYQYNVPVTALKGTYRVSAELLSANQQTDYAPKQDFASYEVN